MQDGNKKNADEVMNYKGLSDYLKIPQGSLRHKVMKCEIPFYKIGSRVRFSKKTIDEWFEKHLQEPKVNQTKNSCDLFLENSNINLGDEAV